jgi:hypothetical protein
MTETELVEALASEAHAGWARYMQYFLGNLEALSDGALYINAAYVAALRRQIALPYAELSAAEQQADRDEVAHLLPIIREYAEGTTSPFRIEVDPHCPENIIIGRDTHGNTHFIHVETANKGGGE